LVAPSSSHGEDGVTRGGGEDLLREVDTGGYGPSGGGKRRGEGVDIRKFGW